jgi:anthranilate phosphoribosyltransferase
MASAAKVLQSDEVFSLRSVLQRIATGPELSKDISRQEACAAMARILAGEADPVQAGVFLIALRMKRETEEENLGILDAVRDAARTVLAPVDEVLDVADPYDGFSRTLPASPFLPVVMASLGVPTVCHGLESVGPKFGVTHRQVLRAAGVRVDLSLDDAKARLSDPSIGWTYIDQREFCPNLHALVKLRGLIVKRPAITTVEKLVGPVRGRHKTHLFTGYVHKGYDRLYALLARASGFDSALIVRGVEGGVIPSLRQSGSYLSYHDLGDDRTLKLQPSELGIEQPVRAPSLAESPVAEDDQSAEEGGAALDNEAIARAAAQAGWEALSGKSGATRDALIYGAALCLQHLGRHDSLTAAADAVRKVLGTKKLLSRFKAQ